MVSWRMPDLLSLLDNIPSIFSFTFESVLFYSCSSCLIIAGKSTGGHHR